METKEFGTRLRELRKLAGLSQRALANKIGVDFSYLSKIESGVMPPPSEQVIMRLAEVLDADKDELMLLAGKIPSDIAQILKNRKALQLLRSERTQKIIRDSKVIKNNKEERVSTMKKLISYKNISRIAIPIVLVCAVAASLWFAAPLPAKALEIQITNSQGTASPTNGTIGTEYTFRAKIIIGNGELLPIKNIDLEIYNTANRSTFYDKYTNLSLGSQDYAIYSTSGNGTAASIKATPDTMWEYFTTGVGYVEWLNYGYYFPSVSGGYGYQTGPLVGATSITYDIKWTPPSGWQGTYQIEAKITAQDDKTFIKTSSSFTLSAVAAAGGGGGGGGGAAPRVRTVSPGVYNVSNAINSLGKFIIDATLKSADSNVKLDINMNTIGKTKAGLPLSQISILEMASPPAPPADSYIIGLVYNLSPDGATFNPAITLTFTYDPDDIPEGVKEEDLVIAIWDEDADKWVELEDCVVDPVTHTITAPLSHFTAFAIIGAMPAEEVAPAPAAFTVSALSISPTVVNAGESVTISLQAANTGDLSGSYEVTLKINNAVVQTKSVTVAGGASETVTFTTTQDVAGTYAIDINGLSGTFTVKTVPAPAAFTVSALSISPTEVNAGESVTISLQAANTGDLSGSYDVILRINDAVVQTKSITIAGGDSQTVTFTTAQDVAGTYAIDINGLSGTFTVKTVPAGMPWWVWVIVGAMVVIVGWLVYLLWWRRR